MPGTLFVVATPIGNLEDITLRALRVLREVAIIAAEDTRRTSHLLARYGISTPATSLHEHNERQKSPMLIRRLETGDDVALVSDAGTPTVSDPGAHLVSLAFAAGIRVEPIPGPSAVISALSVSGMSSEMFTFLGFPPTRLKDRNIWFERARRATGLIVFFESPRRIHATLEHLGHVAGDVPVLITREMTKLHEVLVKGHISTTLEGLRDSPGEFTVVASIGLTTDNALAQRHRPEDLVREFGEMTKNAPTTKRRAVAALARRHGLTPNEVYSALEAAKKSGL